MKNKKKTAVTITLAQMPSDIEYICPHCGQMTIQDFDEFLNYNGLLWDDFPNWQYEYITCPKCGKKIDNIYYEFD